MYLTQCWGLSPALLLKLPPKHKEVGILVSLFCNDWKVKKIALNSHIDLVKGQPHFKSRNGYLQDHSSLCPSALLYLTIRQIFLAPDPDLREGPCRGRWAFFEPSLPLTGRGSFCLHHRQSQNTVFLMHRAANEYFHGEFGSALKTNITRVWRW